MLKGFVIFMKWLSLVAVVATFVGGFVSTPLFFVSTLIWIFNAWVFNHTLKTIRRREEFAKRQEKEELDAMIDRLFGADLER